MRLLVECPECRRQYDASRRPIGSRFRCACGHVIVVQKPDGHDAQVVRCSACGAARTDDDSSQCAYCGAEFTLHERDLNTICPHCFARVSDRARFCHHCGTGLMPESEAGANTELVCPVCREGHRLASRRLGEEPVTVLECGRCAGLWLGHEAFRELVERAKKQSLPAGTIPETPQQEAAKFSLPTRKPMAESRQGGAFYRPCAVCRKLMQRVNYGHASGVIIDICRDHGDWFDADELARILAWLRAGGDQQPTQKPDPLAEQTAKLLHSRAFGEAPRQSFVGALLGVLFGERE
jgi:Zn-finger nucleic acid-binding protein/ribosomal protein L40E